MGPVKDAIRTKEKQEAKQHEQLIKDRKKATQKLISLWEKLILNSNIDIRRYRGVKRR